MSEIKEFDAVVTKRPVSASVISGEVRRDVMVPPGTRGVAVHVHGPSTQPEAFEVEFYFPDTDVYALASIKTSDLLPG